jgi:ATP-dependent RNA circularization protein (DNA/RNA ligase family)
MKKELEGRTLIGEYCGYEKHQHITKYSEIEIIYYAIVENAGTTRCLPVEEAFRFFDKYKMKKVRTTIIKGIRKQNELYQNIYDLMKKTAMGTMAE